MVTTLADSQNSENISATDADTIIIGGGYFDDNITIPVSGVYDCLTNSPYANVTISSGGSSGTVLTAGSTGYNWGTSISSITTAGTNTPTLHVTVEA